MSARFVWDPTALAEILRQRGYDVDVADAWLGEGGSIAARRERSDRAQLVVVDAGARFKAETTAIVADSAWRTEVAGADLRVVETEQRVTSVTGSLPNGGALGTLLDALDQIVGSRGEPLPQRPEPRS